MCQCAKKIPFKLKFLDVGGGLGVNYKENNKAPTVESYVEKINSIIKKNYGAVKVIYEPGRCISASCGFFITKVIRTKTSEECRFTIVDGGMNVSPSSLAGTDFTEKLKSCYCVNNSKYLYI